MDSLSSYNAIIERTTLNSWKAVISTYHFSVKFPTDYGVGQVQGGQLTARECCLAMLVMDEHMQTISIDETRVTTKALEYVPLDKSNLEKFARIRTSMEMKTK